MRALLLASVAVLALGNPAPAQDKPRSPFDGLIAMHAQANAVPESLVHRVIVQESRYNPRAIGRGGTMGPMQIKQATARGVGYTGPASGLLDPDTNLTYAVRYLAGAFRAAAGNADRAVAYFRSGYYRPKHNAPRALARRQKPPVQDATSSTGELRRDAAASSPGQGGE